MTKQMTTPRPHAKGRKAALTLTAAFLAVLALGHAARAQSTPSGPAGGDLAGTYPNPTLAADRVRKAGDSMTGALDITLPNPGGIFTPLTITTAGNSLSGRGTAFAFNVPLSASSTLGGKVTTAWGSLGQTYISFGALNSSQVYGEVFRVDGRGYFGFNTANPTSRLHVVSGTDSATSMLALDTGTHGGTSMTVAGTANNESTFDLSVYRAGAYASRLGVNSAGHVYLQPGGGSVGVGTSSPGYTLDVASPNQWAARFRKTDPTNGGIIVESAAGYNPNIGLSVAGTIKWYVLSNSGNGDAFQLYESTGNYARFTLTQAGTVGIGTAAPNSAYKLDVAGSVNATGLCLGGACKTDWAQVGDQWADGASGAISYGSGNVGIGTASPGGRLSVSGASAAGASVEAHILNSTASGYQSLRLGTDSVAQSNLYLNAFNASWTTSGAAIADSGTVFGAGTGGLSLGAGNASGVLRLYTGGVAAANERVRVDSSGNVGIGSVAPVMKLDVRGAAETTFPNNPGLLALVTTDAQAANMGAGIRFGGTYTGTTQTTWAYVGGVKENSTAGDYGGRLVFGTRANGAGAVDMTRMVIDSSGRVGIGTATPGAGLTDTAVKLDVAGSINVSGNINAKYQDVAEWVPSTQKLSAGTVVVLDVERANHVLASTSAYDTKVAGVVSERPGIALGEGGEDKALVATTGRVRVKVNATHAPIKVGDLLVTSDIEGVAMRSEPVEIGGRKMHAPGTIIGKALEPLEKGTGEILVLLSLQ